MEQKYGNMEQKRNKAMGRNKIEIKQGIKL
jgi:hypothetical protein